MGLVRLGPGLGAHPRTYLCGGFRAIGAEALFLTRPAPATPTWFP